MRIVVILLTFVVSACVSTKAGTTEPQTAQPAPAQTGPTLEQAKHSSPLQIAQTLSPDNRVLSILLQGLEAKASPAELGIGTGADSFAIPIVGTGQARISVDVRGTTAINHGDCELELLSPAGGVRHWTDGGGAFVLTYTTDMLIPATLRLILSAKCWAPSAGMKEDQAEALLFVDSLDITSEKIPPETQQPPAEKKKKK
jgi:hypothetical protein